MTCSIEKLEEVLGSKYEVLSDANLERPLEENGRILRLRQRNPRKVRKTETCAVKNLATVPLDYHFMLILSIDLFKCS
jgi:hypothetical protein